jgi:hypothetical protein
MPGERGGATWREPEAGFPFMSDSQLTSIARLEDRAAILKERL